jgi:hypothetical protein
MVLLAAQHISEHPEEVGYVLAILGTLSYIAKHFWSKKRYEKKLRVLEVRMEGDSASIGGTKNPGRSTVDLLDVMYSDIKGIKETLTRHEGEIGKLKGKAGID